VDPEFARHYYESASTDHWWFRGRTELVEELVAQHGLGRGRALDIGAGSNSVLPVAVETIRLDVVIPIPVGRGPFVRASGLELPFRDSTFSLVALFDLIEHVDDEAQLLSEVRRVLEPGGAVLATVPAHQWLWSRHDVQAAHVRRYSPKDLRAAFRSAGFFIQLCRQFYGFLLIPAIIRKVLRTRGGMRAPGAVVNRTLGAVASRSVKRSLRADGPGLSIALLAFRRP
jgi:SAM-dependent methyltransferase